MSSSSSLAPARLAGPPLLLKQSDERLVELARAGSEPAFEAIVARYRGPLLGYCCRVLSPERAEDAVQQTFVRAFAAFGRGEQVRTLRPWLYRIAHNTALNGLRDRGLHTSQLDERIDGVERPDQAAEQSQQLGRMVAAIQALPARQRDAIVLREFEGRAYGEIADRLGVTYPAVRQLINRARTSLRAGMTALTPFGGLLARLTAPLTEAPASARVAELCGAGGAAAAAKLCATALLSGAIVVGPAPAQRHAHAPRPQASSRPASARVAGPAAAPAARAATRSRYAASAGGVAGLSAARATTDRTRALHPAGRTWRPPRTGADTREHDSRPVYPGADRGDWSQTRPAGGQMRAGQERDPGDAGGPGSGSYGTTPREAPGGTGFTADGAATGDRDPAAAAPPGPVR